MPLKVSDGMGAWIKDFQKSDAPQFKGKSAKERRDQAIAAYLSAKKENVKSADKKPQNYTGPDGKIRTRMVPVDKDVVKEDMTFKVDIEGLPSLFISGNSPGQVKNHLRKLIKQPSMIKSVDRQTKHDVKKMYRQKAQGKGLDENSPIPVNELSPDTMKAYRKAATRSNYSAAQKYARVAGSPTGKKYKKKEMDRQDDIMRRRKSGIAKVDKKIGIGEDLNERTPIKPVVTDRKQKNLKIPNPNYKSKHIRPEKKKRDIYRETNGKLDYGTDASVALMKKKTPGQTNEGNGLWANIHAKRRRGERMRKPGEKGAPTQDALKRARGEGKGFQPAMMLNPKTKAEIIKNRHGKKSTNEKLTIGKIRRAAYKTGKVLGDVQAVKKNKVGKRIMRRAAGKATGKLLGKLFK